MSRSAISGTLWLIGIAALSVAAASGQVTAELSKKLSSPDMAERERAFDELTATKPLSEEAKGAVVALQLLEDKLMYDRFAKPDPDDKSEEGNPVYVGKLTDAMWTIAESEPDRPGVWLALVKS